MGGFQREGAADAGDPPKDQEEQRKLAGLSCDGSLG